MTTCQLVAILFLIKLTPLVTNLSKDMEPDDVVAMLNDYFAHLIPVIFAHDGTVDKYIGDAILAVFGSPGPDAQQHEKAVRAAISMQAAMQESDTPGKAGGLMSRAASKAVDLTTCVLD